MKERQFRETITNRQLVFNFRLIAAKESLIFASWNRNGNFPAQKPSNKKNRISGYLNTFQMTNFLEHHRSLNGLMTCHANRKWIPCFLLSLMFNAWSVYQFYTLENFNPISIESREIRGRHHSLFSISRIRFFFQFMNAAFDSVSHKKSTAFVCP